jgi:hypothetical protein
MARVGGDAMIQHHYNDNWTRSAKLQILLPAGAYREEIVITIDDAT